MIDVKIKKLHPDAIIPKYAKPGDAGMDLTATSKIYDKYGNVSYGVGLAFEIPEGYVGLLFPRSSNCKQSLLLSNSVGILDSGYRGEVFFKFKPSEAFAQGDSYGPLLSGGESYEYIISETCFSDYGVGNRIGQIIIMPYPQINFTEVDELSKTERGEGGFGSTN